VLQTAVRDSSAAYLSLTSLSRRSHCVGFCLQAFCYFVSWLYLFNTETLLEVSRDVGLEVNAEKTKYMIMSRHPNSGQNQNIRIGNENMAKFKSLRTTLTNQNDIHEEIKSRLNSGNACYYSVQNLLSSFPIYKKTKD
jgi:hypothetical protein